MGAKTSEKKDHSVLDIEDASQLKESEKQPLLQRLRMWWQQHTFIMCCPGMGYLPVLLAILMMLSISTTYILAVLNGHVSALFPYISDTGVVVPERNVFSQFLNIAAFLALLNIYFRYKLIHALLGTSPFPISRRLNALTKVNLVIGIISCLGLSMVANFQEDKMEPAHLTGAFMVFGLGVVYAILDSIISFWMSPRFHGTAMAWARLIVGIISFMCLLTVAIGAAISRIQWQKHRPPGGDRMHWKPNDPGFTAHLVSTFAEWALAVSFLGYFLTLIRDFQKMEIIVEARTFVTHLDIDPADNPDERSRLVHR